MEKGYYFDNEGKKKTLPKNIFKKVEKLKRIKEEEKQYG